MAEFVNQTLEDMIPELEEMNQLDLFTVKETKVILKKREGHEYKLQQLTKTKEAYTNYIEYETKLLELLRFRRKKTAQDTKKKTVEKSVGNRIHRLYRIATTRFPDDVSLWEKHIEFTKAMRENAHVSSLYNQVLKLHSRNEDLWVKAALWESSDDGNQNPEFARTLLLKGQRINPQSEILFLQLFKIELDQAKKVAKRKKILGLDKDQDDDDEKETAQDDEQEPVEKKAKKEEKEEEEESPFKLAEIVYSNGLQMFADNPALHLKLLSFVCDVKEASKLREKIIADLQQAYPDVPQVWNALALLHIHRIGKQAFKAQAIKRCLDSYEKTLTYLPTEEMWSLALSSIVNIHKMKEARACDWLTPKMLAMFETALQLETLSEELCLQLLELLGAMAMDEDLLRVAVRCVQLHPSSTRLWLAKLHIHAQQGDDLEDNAGASLEKMLKGALKTVPEEESWPLWEFVLNSMASRKAAGIEGIMETACRNICPMVCKPAKEWSLHWTWRQGGIKGLRNVYKSLRSMRPISLQFFKIYIQIEASQAEPNVKLIRSAFEEAVAEFGHSQPDLWLNYILMEREVTKEEVSQAGTIYDRALSGLREKYREQFIRKHFTLGNTEQ